MNRMIFLSIGFGVWLLATIAIRVAGQIFFLTDNSALMIGLWIVTGIAMLALPLIVFRWQGTTGKDRVVGSALLVLPGMFLDALVTHAYTMVFPNMPADTAGAFGAWLLFAYAVVIIAAFLPVSE